MPLRGRHYICIHRFYRTRPLYVYVISARDNRCPRARFPNEHERVYVIPESAPRGGGFQMLCASAPAALILNTGLPDPEGGHKKEYGRVIALNCKTRPRRDRSRFYTVCSARAAYNWLIDDTTRLR
jgi:hypothetical protein